MKTAKEWIQSKTHCVKQKVITDRFKEADIVAIQLDAIKDYNRLKRASLELARICKEHAKTSTGRQRDLYSAVVLFEDATGLKVETEP